MEQIGQGLAGQMSAGAPQVSVEEVVDMLQQGVPPEELLKQGVPMEVLEQAVQMLMQMEQQAQGIQPDSRQQMQAPQQGLGAEMVRQGM